MKVSKKDISYALLELSILGGIMPFSFRVLYADEFQHIGFTPLEFLAYLYVFSPAKMGRMAAEVVDAVKSRADLSRFE